MAKLVDISFVAWQVSMFLKKHHLDYIVRQHNNTFYYEITMPYTGRLRLVRVADHRQSSHHYWTPDFFIYNQKDYRKFKSAVKRYIGLAIKKD